MGALASDGRMDIYPMVTSVHRFRGLEVGDCTSFYILYSGSFYILYSQGRMEKIEKMKEDI